MWGNIDGLSTRDQFAGSSFCCSHFRPSHTSQLSPSSHIVPDVLTQQVQGHGHPLICLITLNSSTLNATRRRYQGAPDQVQEIHITMLSPLAPNRSGRKERLPCWKVYTGTSLDPPTSERPFTSFRNRLGQCSLVTSNARLVGLSMGVGSCIVCKNLDKRIDMFAEGEGPHPVVQ